MSAFGLSAVELSDLQATFYDGEGRPRALTKDQFISGFMCALKQNKDNSEDINEENYVSELELLFKKIDAGCVGVVDWEGLTNFMLLHLPQSGSQNATGNSLQFAQQNRDLFLLPKQRHKDMINDVVVIPSYVGGGSGGSEKYRAGLRYATVARDGYIKIWAQNLQLLRSIEARVWLSAAVWMKTSHRLAVASSDSTINFYDIDRQPSLGSCLTSRIHYHSGTPLCLAYQDISGKEMLMAGDTNGGVTVYNLEPDFHCCDQMMGCHVQRLESENSPRSPSQKPYGYSSHRKVQKPYMEGVIIKKNSGSNGEEKNYHTDWVTQVGFVSELQALVTSSLDSTINICDIHKNERKRDPIKMHRKGVTCWSWSTKYKFFASGGLDRHIVIWNPYMLKVMSYLRGHNAPIQQVLMNDEDQLVSISSDKVIKIWDLRQSYRCVHTFIDKTENVPKDHITRVAIDDETPCLLLCSAAVNVLPMQSWRDDAFRGRTHDYPIVRAIYNPVFEQIVSIDSCGRLILWDVRTGALEFEFRAHEDAKTSCMLFDESRRRVYTGSDKGQVRLWNVSSGQLLRTFEAYGEMIKLVETKDGRNLFLVALTEQGHIFSWLQDVSIVNPNQVIKPTSQWTVESLCTANRGIQFQTPRGEPEEHATSPRTARTKNTARSMPPGDPNSTQASPTASPASSPRMRVASGDIPISIYANRGLVHIGTESGTLLSFRVTDSLATVWKRPQPNTASPTAKQYSGSKFQFSSFAKGLGGTCDVGEKKTALQDLIKSARGGTCPPTEELQSKDSGILRGGVLLAMAAAEASEDTAKQSENALVSDPPHYDTMDVMIPFKSGTLLTLVESGNMTLNRPSGGIFDGIGQEYCATFSPMSNDLPDLAAALKLKRQSHLMLWDTASRAHQWTCSASNFFPPMQSSTAEWDEMSPVCRLVCSTPDSPDQAHWLALGNQDGCILLFDIVHYDPLVADLQTVVPFSCFRPHLTPISDINIIKLDRDENDSNGIPWVIVTAAQDCTVCLTTNTGVRIGVFAANQDVWDIDDPNTYPGGELVPQEECQATDPFGRTIGAGRGQGRGSGLRRGKRENAREPCNQFGKSTVATYSGSGHGVFHQLSVAHSPDLDLPTKSWEKTVKIAKVHKPAVLGTGGESKNERLTGGMRIEQGVSNKTQRGAKGGRRA